MIFLNLDYFIQQNSKYQISKIYIILFVKIKKLWRLLNSFVAKLIFPPITVHCTYIVQCTMYIDQKSFRMNLVLVSWVFNVSESPRNFTQFWTTLRNIMTRNCEPFNSALSRAIPSNSMKVHTAISQYRITEFRLKPLLVTKLQDYYFVINNGGYRVKPGTNLCLKEVFVL